MKNNEKVVYMNQVKESNKFKRKAMKIGEIVAGSVYVTFDSKDAWSTATTVGLLRGLYKWNARSGLKTGVVVMGVMVSINVVGNLAKNIDKIYKA